MTQLQPINSKTNVKYKLWKSLHSSRGLKKTGLFLLSGSKLVPEALLDHTGEDRFVAWITSHDIDAPSPSAAPSIAMVEKYILSRELFEELDIHGTNAPLLVGKAPEYDKADLSLPPEGLEIVSALGDPANQGALIRVATAMGASKILLLEESAHPFLPKSLRASAGQSLKMNFAYGPSIEDLPATDNLWALDSGGQNISDFKWPKDIRLLVGEEGQGLGDRDDFQTLSISMANNVESLNAVSAVSIALYSYSQR